MAAVTIHSDFGAPKNKVYVTYFSLSDSFHSVWQSLGPFMPLQMVLFHSFYGWAIFHYIYVPHLYPFLCWGAFRMLPCPGYCKQCYSEHWTACILWNSGFLWVYTQEWDCWTTVPFLAATLPCATSMPALLQPRVNHLRKSFESILSFPTARISGAPFCTPVSSVPAVSASAPASPHSTWNPALSVRLPCGALWSPNFHA